MISKGLQGYKQTGIERIKSLLQSIEGILELPWNVWTLQIVKQLVECWPQLKRENKIIQWQQNNENGWITCNIILIAIFNQYIQETESTSESQTIQSPPPSLYSSTFIQQPVFRKRQGIMVETENLLYFLVHLIQKKYHSSISLFQNSWNEHYPDIKTFIKEYSSWYEQNNVTKECIIHQTIGQCLLCDKQNSWSFANMITTRNANDYLSHLNNYHQILLPPHMLSIYNHDIYACIFDSLRKFAIILFL